MNCSSSSNGLNRLQRESRVKSDNPGVETSKTSRWSMNPFDEIAIEEAVRNEERVTPKRSSRCRWGVQQCQEPIATALAMWRGSRRIHVKTDHELQPLASPSCLKALVDKESPDLVILGKQAIDD